MRKLVFETTFHTYSCSSDDIIGEGGPGVVYRVQDEEGKTWALKRLRPGVPTKQRARFQNECAFCMKNVHEHIITVVDHGVAQREKRACPFYVMPYYPSSLRALIRRGMQPEDALRLFWQVLQGVEAAHLQGVWHRDLKPENILYDPAEDRAVVADFGIAHFSEEYLQAPVETKPADRVANVNYAAPEQRRKGGPVDGRADIYALGLILNEMFTGEIPLGTNPKTIAQVHPAYGYLDGIVDTMRRQDPEERPQSVAQGKEKLALATKQYQAAQRLSELTHTVVPNAQVDNPYSDNPVRVVGIDYPNGTLVLKLNRPVDDNWIREGFHRASPYWESCPPGAFRFRQDTAEIHVNVASVQTVVDRFKIYLERGGKAYAGHLQRERAKKEQEERERLQRQIAFEEQRQRVLKNTKL